MRSLIVITCNNTTNNSNTDRCYRHRQYYSKHVNIYNNCSHSNEHTNSYNFNHQTTAQVPSGSSTTNSTIAFNIPEISPTPSQLAARLSITRELPTFSGDPEEWPIFINSFQNSTAVAGFSNVENLIRLQGSLKGKARELIKSKLLLPS
ncbi:hypothetical protein CVS40_11603 [Lucilia cuprina]|nr:hypothetical protein CVS40_11603 [Lucilia cuprina]